MRSVASVKELGHYMVTSESDVCENGGGVFTMTKWPRTTDNQLAMIIHIKRAGPVAPIEGEPINLEELRKLVPATHGVWVYGNWWSKDRFSGRR